MPYDGCQACLCLTWRHGTRIAGLRTINAVEMRPMENPPRPAVEDAAAREVPPDGEPPKKGGFQRFLNFVEWLGNLLPHPVTLFALFATAWW
jgi:hypothetical protein